MMVMLSFNNFSLCLLSSSMESPRHHWPSYSITWRSGPKPFLKRQCYLPLIKKQSDDKHSLLQIPILDDTIGKFFLLEVFMHICLPQSLTYLKKFAAALSQCAAHEIEEILMTCHSKRIYLHKRGPDYESIL